MSSTKSLGVDPERLARIAPFLQADYIDSGKLPCAQTTVIRRGEVVHFSSLGFADPERNRPLQADTIFRIYSMTKPIVSVAFMMLVEEGKVAVDDPVHRFIPSFRGIEVFDGLNKDGSMKTRPTDGPMRMADLLRHTSGLTYDFQQSSPVDAAYREAKVAWAYKKYDLEGFVEAIARIPLVASPGDVWNYSVSTDVVGYLVQKISGRPLEDFLRERIFEPLGMVDTGFHVPAAQAHRLAACYRLEPGASTIQLQDDPETSPYLEPPSYPSGGGGLVSTTADYVKFVRMLLGRGELDGVRIIGPKTLDLMTKNHIPGGRDLSQASISLFSESAYSGIGFGLGFGVVVDQPKTLIAGSNGDFHWGGMASTYFWVDPAEDLACVFMTQVMPSNSYPVRRQLRTMVYAALTETA